MVFTLRIYFCRYIDFFVRPVTVYYGHTSILAISATIGIKIMVRMKKIFTRSPKPTGISDSSMALALSVKNMICDVDSTTTKNALAAATALPLIKVAGMDNAKIPTKEEAAICCDQICFISVAV